jgi:hypothetical protein
VSNESIKNLELQQEDIKQEMLEEKKMESQKQLGSGTNLIGSLNQQQMNALLANGNEKKTMKTDANLTHKRQNTLTTNPTQHNNNEAPNNANAGGKKPPKGKKHSDCQIF